MTVPEFLPPGPLTAAGPATPALGLPATPALGLPALNTEVMNVAELLARRAARRPWGRVASIHTPERSWAHVEVHSLAAQAATVLARRCVGPGDRVLIALPDGVPWLVAFLAVARLGAVAVLVNPDLPAADHAFAADDAGVSLCITDARLEDRFGPGHWLDVEDLLRQAAGAAPAGAHPAGPRDDLYVQYTSGTTGRPKGAVHRHADLLLYHHLVGRAVLGVTPGDVLLSVSRLYFAYGLGNAVAFPLFSGSGVVLTPHRPGPEELAGLVQRYGVTLLFSVPSAYAGLVRDVSNRVPFRSLRAAVTAGEAMPPAVEMGTRALLGVPVLNQIGSTEAGHAFCACTIRRDVPGTLGYPVPGFRLALRAPDGTPIAEPGVPGDLWVQGPTVMRGYLNRPAETAQALSGGWLTTGDRAVRDPGGTYRHLGRADDLEMAGGISVAPQEIEQVLAASPLVADVAVAAVLDEHGASRLRAYVVPARPLDDAGAAGADLLALARCHLAAYKVPRSVEFVHRLPRTPSGKLQRFAVREGNW